MALQEYECPACGGAMEFNPKTQKLKCPYCDSEFDVKDYVANHNSNSTGIAAESTSENGVESEPLFIYTCGSCGGEIITTDSLGSTKCPFCSNNVVVKEKFTGEFKPDYIIPFAKTKEDAVSTYKSYVAARKLIPPVFAEQNHIDEIRGIYVPFWLYDATEHFSGEYKATKHRRWSDSKYYYTETKYYSVLREGTESFNQVPVDASKEMPDDLMDSLEPFDRSKMISFNMGYLAGFLANKYNVSSDESISRALSRMENTTTFDFRQTISGYDSLTPVNVSCNTVKSSHKYALYPVYILNTSWNDKNYLFAMNGQTGKFVGKLPFSFTQALKYYIPFALGFTAIAYIALFFFM
ncbi:replication restart DNA helicase PriA [Butyrivibrio hungatei]|uniref:Replication restart DNA helicase PriA n=1 Tax=Butyrivibrio hungatei TaxID=185008 RepID=A0A1G5FCV0_9FIRM|nr:hypothetical protein [Butyrivibrio hungatei]SCY37007.1 replication restart DNA helicase PriA [Butyrivibrio hungatei]